MKSKSLLIAALLSVGAVLSASAQGAAPAQQQSSEKRFHLDGKIVSVRPASRSAVIDAKPIPGFMGAMSMPYTFKDSTDLAKLKAGDHITGDIVVAGSKTWVEKVVVVKDDAGKK